VAGAGAGGGRRGAGGLPAAAAAVAGDDPGSARRAVPDAEYTAGFGVRGRPGWLLGRLALVTVLQMTENLTDRQAADAVREKVSWKCALGLGLEDEGFDASVLSEFRARVATHGFEQRTLDLLPFSRRTGAPRRAGSGRARPPKLPRGAPRRCQCSRSWDTESRSISPRLH